MEKEELSSIQFRVMSNVNTRSVILRLTEPIVSLMRINEFEKVKKRDKKRYY